MRIDEKSILTHILEQVLIVHTKSFLPGASVYVCIVQEQHNFFFFHNDLSFSESNSHMNVHSSIKTPDWHLANDIYDSFYVILMTDRSLYDICSFWYVVIRRNRIERRRLHEIVSQSGERGMRYLTKRKKLSKVLIRERKRRGLSQQDVATAVGASLRNYQRWESGETFPQPYYWLKLQG